MRTIIAGIGGDVRDRAVGSVVADSLAHDAPLAAARVVVEELNGDPFTVAQRLRDEWPRFDRVIVVGSVARSRPVGTIAAYRWDGELPSDDRVDLAFAAAGNGVVSLEDTLVVAKRLGQLPDDVIVVEVEPEVDESSAAFSPPVAAACDRARTLVRRFATNSRAVDALPWLALGGGAAGEASRAD